MNNSKTIKPAFRTVKINDVKYKIAIPVLSLTDIAKNDFNYKNYVESYVDMMVNKLKALSPDKIDMFLSSLIDCFDTHPYDKKLIAIQKHYETTHKKKDFSEDLYNFLMKEVIIDYLLTQTISHELSVNDTEDVSSLIEKLNTIAKKKEEIKATSSERIKAYQEQRLNWYELYVVDIRVLRNSNKEIRDCSRAFYAYIKPGIIPDYMHETMTYQALAHEYVKRIKIMGEKPKVKTKHATNDSTK